MWADDFYRGRWEGAGIQINFFWVGAVRGTALGGAWQKRRARALWRGSGKEGGGAPRGASEEGDIWGGGPTAWRIREGAWGLSRNGPPRGTQRGWGSGPRGAVDLGKVG